MSGAERIESWRGRRPRGVPEGFSVDVPHLRGVTVGTPVCVRDALGETHDRIAASSACWGHDFAVVWVRRREGKDLTPWPATDVWLPASSEGAAEPGGAR